MNLHKKSRHSGFTLIELLAVVAILGILAGIAVPRVLGAIENARLSTDRANIAMLQSAVEKWGITNNPNGALGAAGTAEASVNTATGWSRLTAGVAVAHVNLNTAGSAQEASWTVLVPSFIVAPPVSPTQGATYQLTFTRVSGTDGTGSHVATVVRVPALP